MKLYLKGARCDGPKCPIVKKSPPRNYPPGQHGQRRTRRPSEYGLQLREKQKVRRYYGVLETQFRKTYTEAVRRGGVTGDNLLQLLESRLDNTVFRMGFATSRAEARQLVRHGHFLVNGRKGSTPSMLLKAGAKVEVVEKSRKVTRIIGALEALEGRSLPPWLEIDKDNFAGTVKAMPTREDITLPIQEQLIVELYSR